MRARVIISALLTTVGTASTVGAQPNEEQLVAACSQTITVMGMDADTDEVIEIGERLDSYCAGFLEGFLISLEITGHACPDWVDLDGAFLVSVVTTYLADSDDGDIEALGGKIARAFMRAFPCEFSPPPAGFILDDPLDILD